MPAPSNPPLGPFSVSVIVASATFLLAGIVWPQAADALLRLLLATIALGFLAARAYSAMVPTTTTHDGYSPFDNPAGARTPPSAPRVLREITSQLGAADDDRLAARSAIPWSVRASVVEEASRRLTDHHGLSLGDPRDHPDIRSLVAEPTWLLIDPADPEARLERGPPGDRRPVPLSQLDLILDDLERL